MRSASVGPSTSSMTSACVDAGSLEAVDRGDVRMIQRRKRLGFALEPGEPVGIGGEEIRKHLMATSRSSRVSRAR